MVTVQLFMHFTAVDMTQTLDHVVKAHTCMCFDFYSRGSVAGVRCYHGIFGLTRYNVNTDYGL